MTFFQSLWGKIVGNLSDGERLMRSFHKVRQELQDNCVSIAASSGKPRGLRWKQPEWPDDFALVRDPASDFVTLFAAVNLSFAAIEGGDMEDVEAVSMIRDATAVFHFQNGRWGTGGRILFNMTPRQAAETVTPDHSVLFPSADD